MRPGRAQGRQETTRAEAKISARTEFHPVGRAAQAAVCKTAEAGAIPARDSILSSIGVERYTPVFQTGIQGAIPGCSTNQRDTNTGASQDITDLAAVVQLRLRVAFFFGSQALQRCSGLLNRRARSITVATHHFAGVAQQRQQQFCKLPGVSPARVRVSPSAPFPLP